MTPKKISFESGPALAPPALPSEFGSNQLPRSPSSPIPPPSTKGFKKDPRTRSVPQEAHPSPTQASPIVPKQVVVPVQVHGNEEDPILQDNNTKNDNNSMRSEITSPSERANNVPLTTSNVEKRKVTNRGPERVQHPLEDEENNSLFSDDDLVGDDDFGDDTDGDGTPMKTAKQQGAENERQTLAKEETKVIGWLRWLVLLILVLIGIVTGLSVFIYVKNSEEESFQDEYAFNADRVISLFALGMETKMNAIDSISIQITSYAHRSNSTFPNVTVPDFEFLGSNARISGDHVMTFYMPMIEKEQEAEWEAYSVQHQDQVLNAWENEQDLKYHQDLYFWKTQQKYGDGDSSSSEEEESEEESESEEGSEEDGESESEEEEGESEEMIESDDYPQEYGVPENLASFDFEDELIIEGQDPDSPNIPHRIHHEGRSVQNLDGPFFPLWQMSPMLPPQVSLINNDFGQDRLVKNAIRACVETGQATFDVLDRFLYEDETGNNAPESSSEDSSSLESADDSLAAVFNLILQMGQYRDNAESYDRDPLSTLIYPVFDSLYINDRKVVGVLYTTIYWRLLFWNILPQTVYGMICVLEDSNGEAITYEINRGEGVFLGYGDLHDPKYDDMSRSILIGQYLQENSEPETRSFTAVDLNTDLYDYTLKVYPSEEFRSIYVTSAAGTEAMAVGLIFLVAVVIFLIYDRCVQRRQKIVMDRAVKATAVVSSLFPENVREQIINEQSTDFDSPDDKKGNNPVNRVIPGMLGSGNDDAFRTSHVNVLKQQGQDPIGRSALASKHPDCTVFFADLAGFTNWSSSREPDQVFQLLEAMFKAFDNIALRRGVFKVETIGDCYMAVTGLPDPQPDHAVRMSKFAMECIIKLDQITADLVDTLGEGTENLTLRIGMHSGEVTAGVLRGDKSRFQLFGDTVNTASRMESTGLSRQIQISQTTADALILANKSHWFTPREEKIVAKGKGEMQTYFLRLNSFSATHKTASRVSYGENSSESSSRLQTEPPALMPPLAVT